MHWHRARLTEEFKAGTSDEVTTFEDYLQLGDRLFEQLDEEVWANIGAGPEYTIVRYNSGSMADSQHQNPNQNSSFEFTADSPRGGTSFAAWYV